MPELPEVETSLRGIEPFITNKKVKKVIIRNANLRWPIPVKIKKDLANQNITKVSRRAKYLLFETQAGTVILHLGMSGHLRIIDKDSPVKKHDHVDLVFEHCVLRYHDPRRFGSIHWTQEPHEQHRLIQPLGPEPLGGTFNGRHLQSMAENRRVNIKAFIMNSRIVVGVGNIYACESLFKAGIHPEKAVNCISLKDFVSLAKEIKRVLKKAITAGGTTLKDFTNANGKPGYFTQSLNVYAREGKPCPKCHTNIKKIIQNQRSTFYCPKCQT